MGNMRINSAESSDLANAQDSFEVGAINTDGATGQEETEYMNNNWSIQLGYYSDIPELKSAIDAKATWTVGKGFIADPETTAILNFSTGFGKDTFNTILENMIRTYNIGGDSFAEIMRAEDGDIQNLKPLDPGSMKIIVDKKGIIKRYEQTNKVSEIAPVKFKPYEIFHLSRNRVADEIHGVSIIDSLQVNIDARNEAINDYKRVMHRNIDPLWIIHLDTDDTAEIAAFKKKYDEIRANGENLYVPKDVVVPELVSVPPNSTLNPITWMEYLNNTFFQAVGVPQIIVGGSQEITEATAKIAYLAFQQTIEEEQLYIEEQVRYQLGYDIELEFPASLENELISDKQKDVTTGVTQPAEMTAQPETVSPQAQEATT